MFAVASIVEAPESSEGATDSHLRMVLITTFSKDAGGKPPNHSRKSYGSESKTPFPYLANGLGRRSIGREALPQLRTARDELS